MEQMVWKVWAPPKYKFFAWLIIQDRVWTADRLQRRGWPNCGLCPLCKQVTESAPHLLFQCRFSQRVWANVASWIGINNAIIAGWRYEISVKEWWFKTILDRGPPRKALASMLMLVFWELWNERNVRVFKNVTTTVTMVTSKIKEEARIWALAGARHLCDVMPRE